MRNRGVEEPSPLRTPQVRRFPVQSFEVSRPIFSKKSRNAAGEGITWKDPSGRKGKTFDLDRRLHTREAQVFAGTRALRKSCVALLDTGSPASSIRKKVWNGMPGSGVASSDGEAPTQSRRWSGFHEKPPTASASVQLNVLLGRKGTISRESSEDTSVRPVVGSHSSPTG